jgi:hypothetical protein
MESRAPEVAERVAAEEAARGAQAVILVGSVATGDAHERSDVDLVVLGAETAERVELRDGTAVSLSYVRPELERPRFRDPSQVGAFVPGWRQAVVLHDPHGLAAAFKAEAEEWTWDSVAAAADAWVAESVTGLTEEVQKLLRALARGRRLNAAVQRSVLALRLPLPASVHLRLLYGTENRLWELVAQGMGERWRRAQEQALGTDGGGFEASCRAALELYSLAAEAVRPLLDERQREVVAAAESAGRGAA